MELQIPVFPVKDLFMKIKLDNLGEYTLETVNYSSEVKYCYSAVDI